MKSIIIGAAAAAALSLSGLSAQASCVDPKSATQAEQLPPLGLNQGEFPDRLGNAAEQIVGTWHVQYTVEGATGGQAFIQWHSDGTEWENISYPVLGGNICMGSWKAVDRSHVYRNHWGWLFTNGALSGYFNETETDSIGPHGNSYSGYNDTKFYDLTGKLTMELTGTASATRIFP